MTRLRCPEPRRVRRFRSLLFAVALLGPGLAGAVETFTLALPAARDTTIYQPADPGANPADGSLWPANAVGDHLFAGRTAPPNQGLARRSLLQFDLSGIPASAEILGVELTLYLSQTITSPVRITEVSLHRALTAWGTGTSDAPGQEGGGAGATPGDATWGHTAFPSAFWNTPGGDFSATASAITAVGDRNLFYSWSGPGLVADLSLWLADPSTHFGWFLIGDESDFATAKRFDSAERFEFDALTGLRTSPLLTVTYAIPEPASALLLLLGSALLFARGRRPNFCSRREAC